MGTPKISIYLDVRRKSRSGLYYVRLRLYYDRTLKHYNTDIELSEKDFEKSYLAPKPRDVYKDIKFTLTEIENRAVKIAGDLNAFSFAEFEKRMFRAQGESSNAIWHYEKYIDNLKQQNRFGTAESYQQSINSLKAFAQSKVRSKEITHLPFEQLTPEFLAQYESWMLKRGKAAATIGIYLRPLRAVFNAAINNEEVDRALYPFGPKKYTVPAGRNLKKALSKADLKALYNCPAGNVFAEKARDFWFLSYQCNGMNIRDILELKGRNLSGENLSFVRTKTQRTTKGNSKPIIVPVTKSIEKVIAKHGNLKALSDQYIFPILNDSMSEEKKRTVVKNFTRFINQHLKPLAQAAGISEEISTYWARHSYTTTAIRNGARMEFIQESLGHKDLKTTMHYWSGFDDVAKREVSNGLMDFNN